MQQIVYADTKLLLASHLIGSERTFLSIIMILLKGISILLVKLCCQLFTYSLVCNINIIWSSHICKYYKRIYEGVSNSKDSTCYRS